MSRAFLMCFAIAFTSACGGGDEVTATHSEIVYGNDNRRDYFELSDPGAQTLISSSAVVLVARDLVGRCDGDLTRAPSLGESEHLCSDEPFTSQPSAAFCSGVLVDWDLVLTAGHCARAYTPSDFDVVFDYYYAQEGELAQRTDSFVPVKEIVAERLDPEDSAPRLDYAWLRLEHPVSPPRRPAPIYIAPRALDPNEPVISLGAPNGVPLKWDDGGVVRDSRPQWLDYFTADADNSHGSSGGGAFDTTLALLGITARGSQDFFTAANGCSATLHETEGSKTSEQFTYAFQAVSGLCSETDSPLCQPECGNPCLARPAPVIPSKRRAAGCTLVPRPSQNSRLPLLCSCTLVSIALLGRRARWRRR